MQRSRAEFAEQLAESNETRRSYVLFYT